MKTMKIKAEQYQFHYNDGKESGVRGLGVGNPPAEIIVNLDNFIMAINRTVYFRISENEYVTIITDEETISVIRNMVMYSTYKQKDQ